MDGASLSAAWDQVWTLLTILLGRRSVQLGYLVSATVLVAAVLVAARRAHWDRARSAVAVAAALALALFPALTLARRGVNLRRSPTCEWVWGLEPTDAEQLLNLVLLLPAGFFAAWALRRIWPVALGALVLSLGAEATQAPWTSVPARPATWLATSPVRSSVPLPVRCSAASWPGAAAQPFRSGPARVGVIRMITRCSRSIPARYSSQSVSPLMPR